MWDCTTHEKFSLGTRLLQLQQTPFVEGVCGLYFMLVSWYSDFHRFESSARFYAVRQATICKIHYLVYFPFSMIRPLAYMAKHSANPGKIPLKCSMYFWVLILTSDYCRRLNFCLDLFVVSCLSWQVFGDGQE